MPHGDELAELAERIKALMTRLSLHIIENLGRTTSVSRIL
jgi:hypothetical protein